jgi:hypothetical protein
MSSTELDREPPMTTASVGDAPDVGGPVDAADVSMKPHPALDTDAFSEYGILVWLKEAF